MWILLASTEDDRTRTFRLTPDSTKTIGRGPEADFVVDAYLVSRLHCRLSAIGPRRLEVMDLDSTNGTFVNDKRVSRQDLRDGDRLRIGRLELTVARD